MTFSVEETQRAPSPPIHIWQDGKCKTEFSIALCPVLQLTAACASRTPFENVNFVETSSFHVDVISQRMTWVEVLVSRSEWFQGLSSHCIMAVVRSWLNVSSVMMQYNLMLPRSVRRAGSYWMPQANWEGSRWKYIPHVAATTYKTGWREDFLLIWTTGNQDCVHSSPHAIAYLSNSKKAPGAISSGWNEHVSKPNLDIGLGFTKFLRNYGLLGDYAIERSVPPLHSLHLSRKDCFPCRLCSLTTDQHYLQNTDLLFSIIYETFYYHPGQEISYRRTISMTLWVSWTHFVTFTRTDNPR